MMDLTPKACLYMGHYVGYSCVIWAMILGTLEVLEVGILALGGLVFVLLS